MFEHGGGAGGLHIGGRQHRDNAGNSPRLCALDRRDTGKGMGRADEVGEQASGLLDIVVGKAAKTADQWLRFDPYLLVRVAVALGGVHADVRALSLDGSVNSEGRNPAAGCSFYPIMPERLNEEIMAASSKYL